ncbi:MAG: hypothetical protein QXP81_06995 [Nitrososphaerota archaeon]
MPRIVKVVLVAFGVLFLIAGLPLVAYNAYWLATRGGESGGGWLSGLGAGFALLFAIVGLILTLIGGLLLFLGLKHRGV